MGRNKKYFNQLEKENGWVGHRQYLIEHLGYFVDYYEPTQNIVVEYDEPRHYKSGMLREKDIYRMEAIKQHLGCQFWRYDEYNNTLKQW
jgi:very-short-patch-repair endonuclease